MRYHDTARNLLTRETGEERSAPYFAASSKP